LIGVARAAALNGDDDQTIAPWPMRFEKGGRPYSPRLVIEAPDDAQIDCLQRKNED